MKIYILTLQVDMYESPSIEYVSENLDKVIEAAKKHSYINDPVDFDILIWEDGEQVGYLSYDLGTKSFGQLIE